MIKEDKTMAFTECGNGHVFDNMQYQSCPYCNNGGFRIDFGANAGGGIGKTVPAGNYNQQFQPNQYQPNQFQANQYQANQYQQSEIGATVAPASYQPKPEPQKQAEDTGKTVAVFQKKMNLEPVVGWFVCIDGPDKGKDYSILAKNNTIGRSEKMDICIKNDSTISRENHARLGYDEKHNVFHLIPGESSNNIYINEQPIYVPTEIEAYTVIEIGETKLIFVPFCNDKFTWKDGLKE